MRDARRSAQESQRPFPLEKPGGGEEGPRLRAHEDEGDAASHPGRVPECRGDESHRPQAHQPEPGFLRDRFRPTAGDRRPRIRSCHERRRHDPHHARRAVAADRRAGAPDAPRSGGEAAPLRSPDLRALPPDQPEDRGGRPAGRAGDDASARLPAGGRPRGAERDRRHSCRGRGA